MSDIILKGKGVWYTDVEGKYGPAGKKHAMSFPPRHSNHTKHTHFHINSLTGELFDELSDRVIGKWPMEIAANIVASDAMKDGYKDEYGVHKYPSSEGSARKLARDIFNQATMDFNATKRKSGDDFNILPLPFGRDGLHSEYKNNHYGGHESRRVPTSDRTVRTDDGKLINNHPRNEAHPTLGQHLESSSLHIASELEGRFKERELKTSIGAKQNVIEPGQITDGVTYRFTSNEGDPTKAGNNKHPSNARPVHSETAAYGKITPMDIVSVLPNDFFVPSSEGGMSSRIMNKLIENGYDQPTARAMARAPINQLIYGTGKDGRKTGLQTVMKNMKASLQLDNPEVKDVYLNHKSQVASEVGDDDNGRTSATIEILAMLKTAEDFNIDMNQLSMYPTAPKSVISGWRDVAAANGGKKIDLAALGSVDERHFMHDNVSTDTDHLHQTMPEYLSSGATSDMSQKPKPVAEKPMSDLPSDDTTQEPLAQDPLAGIGGSATVPGMYQQPSPFSYDPNIGFSPGDFDFKYSNDDPMGVIATIMERVQLHDSGGSLITKYDPNDSYDMQSLSKKVGMSSIDVRAIAMSVGDWAIIAKSFNTTHDVVRAIKRSCGGVIYG
jgi:hypothetical protein